MSNQDSGETNPILVALREVFGPLIKLASGLPAPLAYTIATIITILIVILLGTVIPENLIWLIGTIFLAGLIAFVIVDLDTRRKKAGNGAAEEDSDKEPEPNTQTQNHILKTVEGMREITQSYLRKLEHALDPHSPQDFVETRDPVSADARIAPKWSDRVIKDGAFGGRPVQFLEDDDSLFEGRNMLTYIVELNPREPACEQIKDVIAFMERSRNHLRRHEDYEESTNKMSYRKVYLRKHIQAILELDAKLAEIDSTWQ